MRDLVFGFMYEDMIREEEGWWDWVVELAEMGVDGLFAVDSRVDESTQELSDACRELGVDLILAFSDHYSKPDEARLSRALSLTDKLAVGNCPNQPEFIGSRVAARRYMRMADKWGFEWVCAITHKTVCREIRNGGAVRAEIGDVLGVCCCGQLLLAYLFWDEAIPHQGRTSLARKDLYSEYGLTLDSLREFLSGLRIVTGVGFQEGLNAGSRVYARRAGFAGIMSMVPFNLRGSLSVEVNEPAPDRLRRLGVYGRAS